MVKFNNIVRRAAPAVTFILLLPLVKIAFWGRFVRPIADDYLYQTSGHHFLFQALRLETNGRLTSSIIYWVGYTIPGFLKIVPLISVLLTLTAIFFLIYLIIGNGGGLRYWLSCIGSIVVTTAICLILPGLYTSLFWFSAAVVHSWPISLVYIYAASVVSIKKVRLRPLFFYTLFGVSPLFISMLSEPTALILITICFTTFLYGSTKKETTYRLVGLAGTMAAFLGMLVLLFSPGAQSRASTTSFSLQEVFTQLGTLPHAFFQYTTQTLPSLIKNPAIVLALLLMGIIIGFMAYSTKKLNECLRNSGLLIISLCLAIFINFSVVWVSTKAFPPLRAYFMPVFCLCLVSFSAGTIIGTEIRRTRSIYHIPVVTILLLLLTIVGIKTLRLTSTTLGRESQAMRERASLWDSRDKHIIDSKQNRSCPIRAQSLPVDGFGAADIQPDSKNEINQWLDQYYMIPAKSNCAIIGY